MSVPRPFPRMQSGRHRQTKLKRVFFYVPRPLIDQTPGNDATSLTTHNCASDTNIIYIYMYIYRFNLVESDYRDIKIILTKFIIEEVH